VRRIVAAVALAALTACPSSGDETLASAPADHPLIVAGGTTPSQWNVVAFTRRGETCLEFRIVEPRSTSSYCTKTLGATLAGEMMTAQVEFSRAATWAFGWLADNVERVEVWTGKELRATAVRTRVKGAPYGAFWVQLDVRLETTPELVAVDASGKALARDETPATGGCCVPTRRSS
jgi:hypothetical protein